MFSEDFFKNGSFYFIGIGGVSMSALASLLVDFGAHVRGSDAKRSAQTDRLIREGISVLIGEEEEITEDTVVYTGAVNDGHPQLSAARRAGKRLITRAELLGMVAKEYSNVISVSGCHGKTTCSAMISHIFFCAEKKFTCHIGGEDLLLGNYHSTGREYFITEACEFQRSFLSLQSKIAVILNIDKDHTDCYSDEKAIFGAFAEFASAAEKVLVNADDKKARALPHALSYGLDSGNVRAENIRSDREKYSFTISEKGIPMIRVKLSLVGKVHIGNALAAYCAARLAGLTPQEIKPGIESFKGIKRRFEQVGRFCGVPVICDYAHHPREIQETFHTAQKLCSGTVRLIFQPHTYTRTRDLMSEFAGVLKEAENPIIYKTFAAREKFDAAGSAFALVSRIPEASYVQSPEQLKARLCADGLKSDDVILVLGAGDIYDVALGILD